jgi:hypothetical protein
MHAYCELCGEWFEPGGQEPVVEPYEGSLCHPGCVREYLGLDPQDVDDDGVVRMKEGAR